MTWISNSFIIEYVSSNVNFHYFSINLKEFKDGGLFDEFKKYRFSEPCL